MREQVEVMKIVYYCLLMLVPMSHIGTNALFYEYADKAHSAILHKALIPRQAS